MSLILPKFSFKLNRTDQLWCEINEIDPFGNTPLMLAIKLNRLDAVNVLCDNGADIKHQCYDGDISPLEYAITTKNKQVLSIFVNTVKKQHSVHWENNKLVIFIILKIRK